jgi:hypothetical protein
MRDTKDHESIKTKIQKEKSKIGIGGIAVLSQKLIKNWITRS